MVYLLDKRTGYFFGGGRVDSLFVHFVEDVKRAKKFDKVENIQLVINALRDRTVKFGQEIIDQNPCLKYAPSYADDVYAIVK